MDSVEEQFRLSGGSHFFIPLVGIALGIFGFSHIKLLYLFSPVGYLSEAKKKNLNFNEKIWD